MKVVVDSGLQSVLRIQFDGAPQIVETFLRLAGDGVQQRKTVERIVGLGYLGQDVVEVVACVFVIAVVQLRDGEIEVLFRRRETETRLFELPLAGNDVHPAALLDFDGSVGSQLLKRSQGAVVLALLEQLHGSLIVLE